MAYKVIWSPKANATFDDIIEYLQKKWTVKEIKRFVGETERTVSILSKNPYLFKSSEKRNIHEVLVTQQNLLLYRVIEKEKKIELLVFFDTRQNPKRKRII